jgi:fructose-1,6-bisphosphate aldolase class II
VVNGIELLNKALKEKYAIPQFNINNLEWTRYILEECNTNNSPVILGVSEGAIKYMGGYNVVSSLVKGLIEDLNIAIPVVLHLDHGSSVDSCKKAVDAGFTSVRIDASKYEINGNVRITKEVVDYAKRFNVAVEAEVGHVGGSEDGVANELLYATIEDSKTMVENTNIDSLAPALGSVHGLYKGKPNLDFDRMKKISVELNMPLVLHGGTGIPDEDIRKAISCGICKININTELQIAWTNAVRQYLNENNEVYDPRKVISSGEASIKNSVKDKLQLLGSCNKL